MKNILKGAPNTWFDRSIQSETSEAKSVNIKVKTPQQLLGLRLKDKDQVNFEDHHFQNTCFHIRHRGNMEKMVATFNEVRDGDNKVAMDEDNDTKGD
jgi:hypothetical protein